MRLLLLFMFCLAVVSGSLSAAPAQSAPPGAAKRESAKATPSTAVVNLNTASAAELQTLPGIGAKVAARIIEYREKKGPFKKIEEVMNVQGVGEKSFLKLRAQLSVGARPDAAQQ